MRMRRRTGLEGDKPPMSSMIDVVFLLLIFFIVTQRDVISEAHLRVNMPSTTCTILSDAQVVIDVLVLPDAYFFKGKERSIEYINTALKESFVLCPDAKVDIKTKLDAKHKKIVRLLDVCQASGLTNFNLQALR